MEILCLFSTKEVHQTRKHEVSYHDHYQDYDIRIIEEEISAILCTIVEIRIQRIL